LAKTQNYGFILIYGKRKGRIMVQEQQEVDVRLGILNTLLTTPHRDLPAIYPVHQRMIADDPRFYGQLAAWYNDTGEIRDHKEMFIVNLCLSSFEGHRDVGLAMFRDLPPYQANRVASFIQGQSITERPPKQQPIVRGRRMVQPPQPAPKKVKWGLFRNIPNSMQTEIGRYLRDREASNEWLDACCIGLSRKHTKRLYVLANIKPCERAQAILFEDKPPADSKSFLIKILSKTKDPTEQAKCIVDNKIPYTVASTLIESMTPPVIAALVEVMSPQDLLNNIGSLQRHGAFDNPDLKALIEEKIQDARTGKRVAALKSLEAIKATPGISDGVKKQLEQVADQQMKSKGRIGRSTALFVDKSGSQAATIELGKRIAALVSTVMDAQLYCYACDTIAYPITCEGKDLAAWDRAFAGIRASGWTSCGIGLQYLLSKKIPVEQIVLVTDEGENTAPKLFDVYQQYCRTLNVAPGICIVKTPGANTQLEDEARRLGISVDAWQFGGDFYSLPGLIKFLTKPSKIDMLMEIMGWELPKRKSA
jgi:hypothetical protein